MALRARTDDQQLGGVGADFLTGHCLDEAAVELALHSYLDTLRRPSGRTSRQLPCRQRLHSGRHCPVLF